jgi:alkanesulfonate monooxygenase SsuD/methylene tetrahydromethanopterin reductase-like flavin-dependent oxidoreductase (luciferase family)
VKFGLFYQLPCAPGQFEATRYQETLDQIVYAEELGFDAAWLAELHFYRSFSIMPAPLIVATALAQRTKRIRLGTAVNLLPFHHPLRAAEEGATVDILSNGRLDFGVGRGTIAVHFQGFNVPREESRERFEETLEIIEKAWTAESFSFTGKYYQISEVSVVPKPVQRPHPPIRIAANSPETAEFAGRKGYGAFVASPINPLPVKFYDQLLIYRRALHEAGHPVEKGDLAAAFPVYTADSRVQVRKELEESFMHYFHTIGEQARLGGRGQYEGSYQYLREVRERAAAITYEQTEETMAVFGNPDECIARITEVQREAAMDQLICWFNPGGLVPHRLVMAAMKRFAAEVMPAVRPL